MELFEYIERFGTEEKCVDYFIKQRWGSKDKVRCAHCNHKKIYITKHRVPFKCASCKKRFSVKTNTVLAESNISIVKWMLALYFMGTNKKGISSVELSEKIGVTQKTAWFIGHRIREACIDFGIVQGTTEIDATFIGGREKNKHSNKKLYSKHTTGKVAVIGAISREDRKVVAYPTGAETKDTAEMFIKDRIAKGSLLYADNGGAYDNLVPLRVSHSKGEYVRGDIHTNNIESFWATIKRGYMGIYHQWSKKHIKRYINEFSYRFNHRSNIISNIVMGMIGKRLSYKNLIQ